jgi:hypothetical protein
LAVTLAGLCAVGGLLASAGVLAQTPPLPLSLPAVEPASQATLLQEADAQYQRYAAAPETFFNTASATPTEWPCKVPAAQLEALTGTSSYAAGSGATGFGHSYSDVVIHPVTAACKAGKLDGPVELVYEAVRRAWGPGHQSTAKQTGRVLATLSGGKLVHRLELRKSTEQMQDGSASSKGDAVASSAEHPVGDFIDSATVLVTGDGTKSFLKHPVRTAHGMRLEKRFYSGSTLVSVEHADARGKPDGMAISYTGGEEKKRCFRQGKAADLKACGG